MVEMLKDEAYVPFDIDFSEEDGCAKVITGPNMAGELEMLPNNALTVSGKSSCVRATVSAHDLPTVCLQLKCAQALIVCMAQIGSFVPANSVTLGIHDAVQT